MSLAFMLDTDTVSFALRGQGRVGTAILKHRPSDLCVSVITVAELRYGATRRKSAKLHELIGTFTRNVEVVPFDDPSALEFGRIASHLADAGSPIGELDTLIAAHAMSLDLTLVTNNGKHFGRVPGLRLDNWL
ncbi:MAG: tRNA(fMet)-specific endonuclease VapC [Thermoanaerobaculia bacterium]|jgi:tRNA(fMet)-specific endonuclease VapC|nr:tRNA(fMet)-specific endonuclease VapC [Thermoanaerobaculia bacterium]